jgi:GAF domain-containing protein
MMMDRMQPYWQFCADLAKVRGLNAGVNCCLAFLETCFSPQLCQIIWNVDQNLHLLGSHPGSPLYAPDANEKLLLENGELVLRVEAEHIVTALVPLHARAVLVGWLYLIEPNWNDESSVLLSRIAIQVGPILAILESSGRRDERLMQLQLLNEIGRLLSAVLDLDTLLEAIYDATKRLADAPVFYIAFYDASTDILNPAYLIRDGKRQLSHEQWTSTIGLADVVVRERQAIRTDDYIAECQRRGVPSRQFENIPAARAWLGVPLIAHDRLIGIMAINSYRKNYAYSDEHVDVLVTIAAQAAVAIDNARLYQRNARQARQLATLNQIGRTLTSSLDPERVPALIIEQVTDLLNIEEGSLLLADQATGDLVFAYTTGPFGQQLLGQRIPRGAGLAGYVFEHGQSVIVNDAQRDERFDNSTDKTGGFVTRAILAVPLRGVGGVHGVIEALNRRDGGQFTIEDQQLLEALADQAVIALENARRFAQVDQALARRAQELVRTNDRLQHNLRSLTALNALGMAITTSPRSSDEIFGVIVRGVVEITGASGACVLLGQGEHFHSVVEIGPSLPLAYDLMVMIREVLETRHPKVLLGHKVAVLELLGVHTLFVVPLRATQRIIGCLCVLYADITPDAPDQELVILFATQAAVAVESLELYTVVRSLTETLEQRQEIDSPYIIGVPLTEQQEIFVGRADISARIEQLLLDRRRPPLLLYGQRRMGKTSLLNNLGRLLPSTIVPLFVDLQGPAAQSSDHVGLLYNLGRGMAESAQRHRSLALPPLSRDWLTADPFTRFDEWLDEVEAALGQSAALLTLDEFEALDGAFSSGRFEEERVLGMLRNLIQHRPRFKVLLAGSHTLDEFQRWASYLINVQVVRIDYLKEAEARQLVERPVEDFALRYEPDASQRVLDLTRGHPFLVQLLCAEIVALKNEQEPSVRRLACLNDVEAAVPEALSSGSLFFADIQRNQIDTGGRALLRFLAAQEEGATVDRETLALQVGSDIRTTLDLLIRRELIEAVDGGYRFQVELIRRWFADHSE